MGGSKTLPPGTILEVLAAAGVDYGTADRPKRIHCPFHDDRNPDAVVNADTNTIYCHACGIAFTAKQVAQRLQVDWRRVIDDGNGTRSTPSPQPARAQPAIDQSPSFTAEEAVTVWGIALQRAMDDDAADADVAAYDWLDSRGLMDAWELGALGILARDQEPRLPSSVRWWPSAGYRVLCPLYSTATGELVSVQARSILERPYRGLKVMTPKGGKLGGTVFANRAGREVLRGQRPTGVVLVCEGLTDFLAAVGVYGESFPVISIPGVSNVTSAIGPWVDGHTVFFALDPDIAGQRASEAATDRACNLGAVAVPIKMEKDLCEMIQTYGLEGQRQLWNLLDSFEGFSNSGSRGAPE